MVKAPAYLHDGPFDARQYIRQLHQPIFPSSAAGPTDISRPIRQRCTCVLKFNDLAITGFKVAVVVPFA